MIIALLNQKGVVGKTTLATHIAGELAMQGSAVILIDADPQGLALDWTQRRRQNSLPRLFGAVGLARETLHQEASELAKRCDHVVIDGPPRIAALARSANQNPMRVDMAVGAKCRTHSHAPAYFPLRGVKGSLRRAAPALDSASGAGTVGRRRPIRN
jgi:hypothetical protein